MLPGAGVWKGRVGRPKGSRIADYRLRITDCRYRSETVDGGGPLGCPGPGDCSRVPARFRALPISSRPSATRHLQSAIRNPPASIPIELHVLDVIPRRMLDEVPGDLRGDQAE